MKKDFKPGELFNKHKEKMAKKKHKMFGQSNVSSYAKSLGNGVKSSGATLQKPEQLTPYTRGVQNGITNSVKFLKKNKKSKSSKKKNWIQSIGMKKGTLHRELGVKAGSKIPTKKLTSATKKGGKEGKRARLAETLKSFRHKKGKKMKFTKKNDHDADDKMKTKKKVMCKKHKKTMCKSCSK